MLLFSCFGGWGGAFSLSWSSGDYSIVIKSSSIASLLHQTISVLLLLPDERGLAADLHFLRRIIFNGLVVVSFSFRVLEQPPTKRDGGYGGIAGRKTHGDI
jgi:hypothetical protein